MFRSTSSSAVGRMESLRINRAPIASFVSAWSFSACSLRIFLFISSCRSGRSASFSDKLSFRAIFAARSGCGGSSRYNIGPSFESLSSSSFELPAEPFEAPYGLAFSLFSSVHGNAKPKRVGRELQRFFSILKLAHSTVSTDSAVVLQPLSEGSIAGSLHWWPTRIKIKLLCNYNK